MNASSPQEFLGKAWMNACRSGQQRLAAGGMDQAAEHGDDLGGAFMHKRHAAQRAVLVVMQGMSGTDADGALSGVALVHESAPEIIAVFGGLIHTPGSQPLLTAATGIHPSFAEELLGR